MSSRCRTAPALKRRGSGSPPRPSSRRSGEMLTPSSWAAFARDMKMTLSSLRRYSRGR